MGVGGALEKVIRIGDTTEAEADEPEGFVVTEGVLGAVVGLPDLAEDVIC